MSREPIIVEKNPGVWVNKHLNVNQPIDILYDVWNPPPPVTSIMSDIKLTVQALQKLIGKAQTDHKKLRAIGGGWSLSTAAVTDGRLINTKPLNWYFPFSAKSVSKDYPGDRSSLMFLQCGVSIAELNSHLAAKGRCLKTSGASNGQTIAGAIATGTHGSAFDIGSVHDTVVALHIIVSPDKSVWLERNSYPIISDDFASRLDTEIIRDDDLINAALVSFGSFGIVHGVVIESDPIFLLDTERKLMPLSPELRQTMNTLDFSQIGINSRPYHFEVVVNPSAFGEGVYVTTMHKRHYTSNYTPPNETGGGLGPGDDLLCAVGTLIDAAPDLIGTLLGQFSSSFYKESKQTGTIGEIFSATNLFGKGSSTELGIPLNMATSALDCIMDAHNSAGPFAGFIAFRYVKSSNAKLAFTKFSPVTCTVEFPGVHSSRTRDFFELVWKKLDDAGIPYTFHWGQENNFTPGKVLAMYGNAVDEWIQARNRLLNPQMREIFNSPFMESCGLGLT